MRCLTVGACLVLLLGCQSKSATDRQEEHLALQKKYFEEHPEKKEIIVYSAKWCGYCHQAEAAVKEYCTEHPDVVVRIVDIEDKANASEVAKTTITGLPTIHVMRNNRRALRLTGFSSRAEFRQALAKYLE